MKFNLQLLTATLLLLASSASHGSLAAEQAELLAEGAASAAAEAEELGTPQAHAVANEQVVPNVDGDSPADLDDVSPEDVEHALLHRSERVFDRLDGLETFRRRERFTGNDQLTAVGHVVPSAPTDSAPLTRPSARSTPPAGLLVPSAPTDGTPLPSAWSILRMSPFPGDRLRRAHAEHPTRVQGALVLPRDGAASVVPGGQSSAATAASSERATMLASAGSGGWSFRSAGDPGPTTSLRRHSVTLPPRTEVVEQQAAASRRSSSSPNQQYPDIGGGGFRFRSAGDPELRRPSNANPSTFHRPAIALPPRADVAPARWPQRMQSIARSATSTMGNAAASMRGVLGGLVQSQFPALARIGGDDELRRGGMVAPPSSPELARHGAQSPPFTSTSESTARRVPSPEDISKALDASQDLHAGAGIPSEEDMPVGGSSVAPIQTPPLTTPCSDIPFDLWLFHPRFFCQLGDLLASALPFRPETAVGGSSVASPIQMSALPSPSDVMQDVGSDGVFASVRGANTGIGGAAGGVSTQLRPVSTSALARRRSNRGPPGGGGGGAAGSTRS